MVPFKFIFAFIIPWLDHASGLEDDNTVSSGLPSFSCLIAGSYGCSITCGWHNQIATGRCVAPIGYRWKECECVEKDNLLQDFHFILQKLRIELINLYPANWGLVSWINSIFKANNLDGRNRIYIDGVKLFELFAALRPHIKFDLPLFKILLGGLSWGKDIPIAKIGSAAGILFNKLKNLSEDKEDGLKAINDAIIGLYGGTPLSYNPTYIQTLLSNLLPKTINTVTSDPIISKVSDSSLKPLEQTKSLFQRGRPLDYMSRLWSSKDLSPIKHVPQKITELIKLVFSSFFPQGSDLSKVPLNRENMKILINIFTLQPDFSVPDSQLDNMIENVKSKLKLSDFLPLNEDNVHKLVRIFSNDKVKSVDDFEKSIATIRNDLKSNSNGRQLITRSSGDWNYRQLFTTPHQVANEKEQNIPIHMTNEYPNKKQFSFIVNVVPNKEPKKFIFTAKSINPNIQGEENIDSKDPKKRLTLRTTSLNLNSQEENLADKDSKKKLTLKTISLNPNPHGVENSEVKDPRKKLTISATGLHPKSHEEEHLDGIEPRNKLTLKTTDLYPNPHGKENRDDKESKKIITLKAKRLHSNCHEEETLDDKELKNRLSLKQKKIHEKPHKEVNLHKNTKKKLSSAPTSLNLTEKQDIHLDVGLVKKSKTNRIFNEVDINKNNPPSLHINPVKYDKKHKMDLDTGKQTRSLNVRPLKSPSLDITPKVNLSSVQTDDKDMHLENRPKYQGNSSVSPQSSSSSVKEKELISKDGNKSHKKLVKKESKLIKSKVLESTPESPKQVPNKSIHNKEPSPVSLSNYPIKEHETTSSVDLEVNINKINDKNKTTNEKASQSTQRKPVENDESNERMKETESHKSSSKSTSKNTKTPSPDREKSRKKSTDSAKGVVSPDNSSRHTQSNSRTISHQKKVKYAPDQGTDNLPAHEVDAHTPRKTSVSKGGSSLKTEKPKLYQIQLKNGSVAYYIAEDEEEYEDDEDEEEVD